MGSESNVNSRSIDEVFRGFPGMHRPSDGNTGDKENAVVGETLPIVWCHRAQENLLAPEARRRHRPGGADDPGSAACLDCTCCLN